MSHDQLSLTPRLPAMPSVQPLPSMPSMPAANPLQKTAPVFQADSYTPSASRQADSAKAIAQEIQAIRERLVQVQARLEAVLAQLESAPPALGDVTGLPDPQADMPVSPDGAPDHSQMAMDTDKLKAEFVATDRDQNGDLDFQEIVAHEEGDEAKAELHFTDADRDQSQVVDLEEWVWHHQNSPLHTGVNAAP